MKRNCTPYKVLRRKKAFTLAEVLITLAIIGIVAALTIPNVIKSYKRHELEVRLRTAYSILSNALNLSVAENGPTSKWNYRYTYNSNGTKAYVDKYFMPYLGVARECSPTECPYENQYSGNVPNLNSSGDGVYRVILKNGIILNFWHWLGPRINIDVNGFKGPNKNGYEIFYFYPENNKLTVGSDLNMSFYQFARVGYCSSGRAEAKFCTACIVKNKWKIPTLDQYIKWGGSANNYMWK